MRKVIGFSLVGAVSGTLIGATLMGLASWVNESSNDPDWESQWVFAAVFVGAKLGLLVGTIVGLIIGLVTHVRGVFKKG